MSCNQVVLELAHDVVSNAPNKMATVIERLRVKGAPAPRNTPASPLLSRSSRAIPSTVIALDKSYEIVLKNSNKQLIEAGNTVAVRRQDFLSRLQHANQGITSMDSPYDSSEVGITEEKPSFVLCGKPVNGFTTKTIDKYLKDQRVGNYKTSAHEVTRVKLQNKESKTRSEPNRSAGLEKSVNFNESLTIQDTNSIKSNNGANNPPPTTPAPSVISLSKRGTNMSSFELTGKNFRSASSADWREIIGSSDQKRSRLDKQAKSADNPLKHYLRINNKERARNQFSDNSAKSFSLPNSFSTKGIRKFNNPYRLLKYSKRQMLLHQKETTDHDHLQRITHPPKSAPHYNGKSMDLPKSILRVPNPCSETFLLQMMLDSNTMSGRKHTSSKYSDIAVHKDLEEFIMIRSPSSQSKGMSNGPKSSKSGKSVLNGLDEESIWPGNDVQEEALENRTSAKTSRL